MAANSRIKTWTHTKKMLDSLKRLGITESPIDIDEFLRFIEVVEQRQREGLWRK